MKMASSSMKMNREKVVERVIYPAIRGQKCPICLNQLHHRRAAVITACKHAYCLVCIRKWSDLKRICPLCNAEFDSWFCNISFSNFTFLTHQLPPRCRSAPARPRVTRITRSELSNFNSRSSTSTPLPWRRQFGRPGSVPPHVIAQRKLEWRASVYNRHLQAVPIASSPSCFHQGNNNCAKERLRLRVEPWIQRELRALLGDLDILVIVHVATSLLISSVEKRLSDSSRQRDVEDDDFLAPLRPFLHDHTNTFWHELRCFGESLLTMETYDAVVEYRIFR